MTQENKNFLEKYLSNASISTSTGEHLFATNIILNEIAKNTAPETVNVEDKKSNIPNP